MDQVTELNMDIHVKRRELTKAADAIRKLVGHPATLGDCQDNLMLAVRHIEDAEARLGRVEHELTLQEARKATNA